MPQEGRRGAIARVVDKKGFRWWAPLVIAAAAFGIAIATTSPTPAVASANATRNGAPSARHLANRPINAKQIYLQYCSVCHGPAGRGSSRAPSLLHAGEAMVDFQLSTGRMPRKYNETKPPPYKPFFPEPVIKALDKYVTTLAAHGGPALPKINPAAGSLHHGFALFDEYCAVCHNFEGRGGELVNRPVPELQQATPQQVADAVRAGPSDMPKFGIEPISTKDLNSIIAYVEYTHHPANHGGNGLDDLGPFASGAVAWIIVMPVVLAFLRACGKRSNEQTD